MPAARLFEILSEQDAAAPRCALEEEYGAALVVGEGRVAVNFVSTIDGIVSFGRTWDDSRAVGGGAAADRTLMAMLRAVAGVIVVGAATLRAAATHQWTPRALLPGRAAELVGLREAAGLGADPAPLLVVSASADIPGDAAAVARPEVPAHVLTAAGLAPAAEATHPADRPSQRLSGDAIVEAARSLGPGPILCEGGAHLFGSLLEAGMPADLFLTVAPQLAGRSPASPQRRSLVEGTALAPFERRAALRSARRAGDHLLLRYFVQPG